MRVYFKLILFIAAFLLLSSAAPREAASDAAYALRVQFVLAFGTHADFEALVDGTQKALAARGGRLDVYETGKRCRVLLEERLADAARREVRLTEEQIVNLRAQCMRQAYHEVAEAPRPISDAADTTCPR